LAATKRTAIYRPLDPPRRGDPVIAKGAAIALKIMQPA
jgi:hypothetical protein